MTDDNGTRFFEGILFALMVTAWCVVVVLTCTGVIRAEETTFNFKFENDFFAPGGEDKWLTSNLGAEYIYTDQTKVSAFTEMYTPKNKRSTEIPYGDRPWDGYTYIGYRDVLENLGTEYRYLEYRVGAVGTASGARDLQKFVHNDLGFGSDPTWAHVNPSEPTFECIYSHVHDNRIPNTWVGDTQLITDYGLRLGNVQTSAYLDNELRRGLFESEWASFIFSGLRGEGIAYNTFLDGRLFQDNVYTVDSVPFVASARIGVGFELFDWILSYQYLYQTEQFEGQDGRHLRGLVQIGRQF